MRRLALILLAILVAGCGTDFNTPTKPVSSSPGSRPPKPSPTPTYVGKPIQSVTPGVILTRDKADVCTPGWATTHRDYLRVAQKRDVLTLYGLPTSTKPAEWDHLVSLELGGGNGPENIWPQMNHAQDQRKDRLENRFHDDVCDGRLTLTAAQREIKSFWRYW